MEDLIIKQNDTELVSALHSGLDLPLPFEQDIFLYGTEIAGTNYQENIAALYEAIQEGDILTLIREPENPYDEYAIRIDVDEDGLPGYNPELTDLHDRSRMLGYVPRAFNRPFARLMDAGKLLYGVVRHKTQHSGYHRIIVKIYLRE
ncbi:MAG: HIRAN domain-containing protein, partial [Clostridiales bacterium]|nr:HIRAN domain-containing protein [Clostridiales bacterium]